MGTNECSQPASKSSWDSQDFGDVNMVSKWLIFVSPPGHNELNGVSLKIKLMRPPFQITTYICQRVWKPLSLKNDVWCCSLLCSLHQTRWHWIFDKDNFYIYITGKSIFLSQIMLTGWRTEYDAVDQEALYRHPKLVNLNHRGIVRHV